MRCVDQGDIEEMGGRLAVEVSDFIRSVTLAVQQRREWSASSALEVKSGQSGQRCSDVCQGQLPRRIDTRANQVVWCGLESDSCPHPDVVLCVIQ